MMSNLFPGIEIGINVLFDMVTIAFLFLDNEEKTICNNVY